MLDAAKRAGGEERAVAKLERASEGRQAEILAERSEGYIGRIIASADNIGEKEEAELRSVVGLVERFDIETYSDFSSK